MSDRRIDAFFYGLFMDVDVLRESNVVPINPRRAYVDDFALRIGQRATLLPSSSARAYGMLIELTHQELERLYTARGSSTTVRRRYSPTPSKARRCRHCATTCSKRRDHTSAIRTT